jgi:hypothetical protein
MLAIHTSKHISHSRYRHPPSALEWGAWHISPDRENPANFAYVCPDRRLTIKATIGL